MSERQFTALVMAANRPGGQNPVAAMQDRSHKAQVTINGRPMLGRVVDCLRAARSIGRIVIAVEDPSVIGDIPELAAALAAGEIETVSSRPTLYQSLQSAIEALGPDALPILVATADNPLLTPEMVDEFCDAIGDSGADLAIAMAPMGLTIAKYPRAAEICTHHEFKDGKFSTCNLYGVSGAGALTVAQVLETGGQFRRKRSRIIKAFGLRSFFLYIFKLRSFAGIMAHVSKRFGVRVQGVVLPYAEGPIDVDTPASFQLAENILKEREG